MGGHVCVRVRADVEWAEEEYGEGDGDRTCVHVHRVVGCEGLRRRCVCDMCIVHGLAMVLGGRARM